MKTALISPAKASFWGIPTVIFSVLIPVIGVAAFSYIMTKRLTPLISASPDNRFDRIANRTLNLFKLRLGQWRQSRYLWAGILHILIFAGFIILMTIQVGTHVYCDISQGVVIHSALDF